MIYIVKHKEYDNEIPKGYKEIGVGDMFDGKGENINHLNPYINEATAYYWLWKNSKDKTIGVCHYRRFFAEHDKILDSGRVSEILKVNDIITLPRYYYTNNLYTELKVDLAKGKEHELCDKYLWEFYKKDPSFKDYMMNDNSFIPREMIIASRKVFNELCEELFDTVIPIAEKYHKEDSESRTNPRLVGFITERYLSYLIERKKYDAFIVNTKEV